MNFLAGNESEFPESNSAHRAIFALCTAPISIGELVRTLSGNGVALGGGIIGAVGSGSGSI